MAGRSSTRAGPRTGPSSSQRRRYRSLTLTEITDAALELLADGGVERLTMRGVASRLQHPVMNLYHYVEGKDGLLDAAVERVLETVDTSVVTEDWRADVTTLLDGLRRALRGHPGVAGILVSRPSAGPHALRFTEALLAALSRGGLTDRRLALAYTMLRDVVLGLALAGDAWRTASVTEAEINALRDNLSAQVETLPHVQANLRSLLTRDDDEQFEFVVATTLAGLQRGRP